MLKSQKFASKMGCETVVFSGTGSKREEALRLGASEFFATKDAKELKLDRGVDVLLVTTSQLPDWNLYLPILSAGAKIFPLSLASGDFALPYMPLLMKGITVQGSIVAPRQVQQRMLAFAAHHNIKPIVNKFEMNREGIEDAFKALDEGKMRYRGVLVAPKGK